LEQTANEAFDIYREVYFEGGLSSVYLWDLEEGFAGVVLLKKNIDSDIDEFQAWFLVFYPRLRSC